MTNPYVQLRRLLPPPPVLLGTVLEHHADDTSTIELPIEAADVEYADGVVSGARLRVRGTSVAVGQRAFVRDGVIESRGPEGEIVAVPVGRQVLPPAPIAFTGTIPDQTWTVGGPITLGVSSYFTSPFTPLGFKVNGTLPAGVTFNPVTGVFGGSRTNTTPASLSVTATDAELRTVTSNTFTTV